MTVRVRGPIKLVTNQPSAVTQVQVRAPALRLHGAGIVTDHNDDIPVRDGQVEFEALPGPAVLTLVTAGGAPLRSVDIVVPDEETATLSECLDPVYVYDPPVVGRAQMFSREAGEHADRAEAGADRVGSAEQVGQWVGEAEVLRDDTVEAADRAQTQAGVATEQAGLARADREAAEDAADSAHGAAGAAAEATKTEIRAEMDSKVSEAEQSAQSAGQSAAASATSAGESATSAQEAGQSAQAAGQHLQDASHVKDELDAWFLEDLLPAVAAVSGDAAATADDRRQTGEDRTATGEHLAEVERLHGETEQARDDAQAAAEGAAGAAAAEVEKLKGDAPEAFDTLGEIADELASNESERAALANSIGEKAKRTDVEAALAGKADTEHRHPADHIDGLDELIDRKVGALNTTWQQREALFISNEVGSSDGNWATPDQNYVGEGMPDWVREVRGATVYLGKGVFEIAAQAQEASDSSSSTEGGGIIIFARNGNAWAARNGERGDRNNGANLILDTRALENPWCYAGCHPTHSGVKINMLIRKLM